MKECGECAECCKGPLKAKVFEHQIGNGIPCPLLKNNKCSVYDTRDTVCREYVCTWKSDDNIPDFMRPDKSHILITDRTLNGHYYWDVVSITGKEMPLENLSLIIKYVSVNKLNLVWKIHDKFFWIGSDKFVEEANKDMKLEDKKFIPIKQL